MEYWKIGFQRYFSIPHYSIIPAFHYSLYSIIPFFFILRGLCELCGDILFSSTGGFTGCG